MNKGTNNKAKHRVPLAIKEGVIETDMLPGDPPAYEEIAALAYSYWEGRGHQVGSAEEDWLRAEEEIHTRHARMKVAKQPRAAAKGAGA